VKKHKRLFTLALINRRVFYRFFFSIRHKLITRKYLKNNELLKLNLACGRNPLSGWLNTDIDTALTKQTVFLDVRKRFPFSNSIFSYVYCEHLIEHLEYKNGVKMVNEIFRVVKPGGKIRVSTPDLNFLIELHAENKTRLQEDYINWASTNFDTALNNDTAVINTFFRSWGHKFIYDLKTLKVVLEQSGFINIITTRVGASDDKNLQNLEAHNSEIGNEFNILESLVVEATRPL
jgi:predicted SAM-dependent methyltransferase